MELFELVQLYMGNGLDIAGYSVVILEGVETVHSLLRSPIAETLKLVKLSSGDGLEMQDHLVVTVGERLHGNC